MNITILDSWLKEYLKTKSTPKKIAEILSLTSVSIERIEEVKNDYIYDIEVTTNRPDLASVIGLAREAGAALPQAGIPAVFTPPKLALPKPSPDKVPITIHNDSNLINRITAVVMEVTVKSSPEVMQTRLEAAGIRSLNNLIDITNYVMRAIGHPAHVFDYDRLGSAELTIRESKQGEEVTTLDNKHYTLPGGDIVAVNSQGDIIDLIGIMGLKNSVVTENTKRILFFLDNNEKHHIRHTSMALGIRTEAAQLNEKDVDPELAMEALLYGIELYQEYADGKVLSDIIDIYPNKPKPKTVSVSEKHLQSLIGIPVSLAEAERILKSLGFSVERINDTLKTIVPTFRQADIAIPEDLIEEIARVYGYQNIPNTLPPLSSLPPYNPEESIFFWERRAKELLKHWGFTEVYTYSMVSEELFEGDITTAVALANPLAEDMAYMRRTLVSSLLSVLRNNTQRDHLQLFEIANIYEAKHGDLPVQTLHMAGVIKRPGVTFFHAKGVLEQLAREFGITLRFTPLSEGGIGASVFIDKTLIGQVEVFSDKIVNFELDFEIFSQHATTGRTYSPISKYPALAQDLALLVPEDISYADIVSTIKKQSDLIVDVSLLDVFGNTRTFHIVYQSIEQNLTNSDVAKINTHILSALQKELHISPKE